MSESFKQRLHEAALWEAWVAATLTRAGLYVLNYPCSVDDKKDLTDPDLVVAVELEHLDGPGKDARAIDVEVKGLGLTFLDPETYPFAELLVCSRSSFMRKWPKTNKTGRDFLYVSRPTGSIVWLPVGTQVTFSETFDQERGELYKTAKTPSSNLRPVIDFVEMIKSNV